VAEKGRACAHERESSRDASLSLDAAFLCGMFSLEGCGYSLLSPALSRAVSCVSVEWGEQVGPGGGLVCVGGGASTTMHFFVLCGSVLGGLHAY